MHETSSPEPSGLRHPIWSWITLGRIGLGLSLVPFAAIAVGGAFELP
jgi:hypothetical protein